MLALQAMTQEFKPMDYDGGQAAAHDAPTPLSATQASIPSNPVADTVSSLRALALSTMRPKRRKEPAGKQKAVPSVHHPPVRPAAPTENTILLDYGTEANEEQIQPASLDVAAGNNFSADNAATPTEDEIKEEGEISDEEPDPLPTSPTSQVNDTLAGSSFRRPDNLQLAIIGSSMSTNGDRLMSSSSSFNEQTAIHSSASSKDYDVWANWVPTEDEVRPGLRMNMEQFNLVKELILDLLGWGVSPEYLVDCGLTREAVFYTFTELNLRLPRNLDTTDLLPLPLPPLDGMARSISSTPTQPAEVLPDISSSGTPQQPPEISSDSRRRSLTHPLPLKPPVPQVASSAALTCGPSGSQNRAITQKLSDLEAQRKQELQARKAVLASRRKKAVPPASSGIAVPPILSSAKPSMVLDGPILEEPVPLAPTEAVDDFLKSMLETTAPSSQTTVPPHGPKGRTLSGGVPLGIPSVTNAPASGTSSTSSTETHFAMDVDPGKAFKANRSPDQSVHVKSESPVSSVLPSASAQMDVEFPGSIASSSSAQDDTSKGYARPYTGLLSPSISIFERPTKPMSVPASPTPGRLFKTKRGTKRPVAMDFVDFEQQPAISRTSAPSPVPPPFVRRKLNSFAGLGGHNSRRCVIDLSDSEDDEYDDTTDEGVASAPEPASRSTNEATTSTAIPTTHPQSSLPQNTSGIIPVKSATPVISPASLAEKEQQIKRMKELIAKREQERSRKLAEKSRTPAGTPPPTTAVSTTTLGDLSTTTASVNVENIDPASPAIQTPSEHVSGSSHSPSPSTEDQADEDIVMETLNSLGSSSDSALATPTDTKMDSFEHDTTKKFVLDAEARGEIGQNAFEVSESATTNTPVDVPGQETSSAQTESQQETRTVFSTYSSPFYTYPLLRSRSRVVADLASEAQLSCDPSPASCSSTSTFSFSTCSATIAPTVIIPDLRPLRVAVMTREAGSDPDRRVCQFEIPGSGVCHDKSCTDLHLNDLEPNDNETARYLIETMPDILQGYNESEIVDQLLQARQRTTGLVKASTQSASPGTLLEDRISQAIAALVGPERTRL